MEHLQRKHRFRHFVLLRSHRVVLVILVICMIPLVGRIQAQNDLQPLAAPFSQGQTSPTGQAGYWDLIFSDEFTGTSLNQDKWTTCYWWDDDGCSNEGNNELQWYMPDDVLVQDGMLRLRARERTVDASNGETYDYTSGMVTTGPPNYKDLPPRFSYMYGFTEIRAKVPVGKGLWPAFWMLPTDYTSKPEIDVLEVLGDQINVAHLTYHYLDQYGFNMRANYDWIGPDFSADWHVFGVDWTPEAIIWYIDGIERFRFDEEEYIPAVEMYLLLNLAVGGDWPGAPDDETVFPNFYDIDYVRVWKPGVPPTATPTPTVTPTHTSTSTPTITSTATPEPTITATIEPTASMPDIGETSVMGNLTSGLVDPTFVWVPDVEVNQWYQIAIVNADGEIILSDWINVSDTCATGWCNFTPGSNLPTGLANGNYTWWIQGWNAENGYGEWSQGESFTVDVPLPLPIHFDINPNQGRPEFTWNHEPNALWYQMYMQNTEGEARFQKWVEARKICTDDVCHFEPDVNPVGGTYQVWIQAWGAAGSNEWVGPVEFSLPQTPPDPPTGLTVSYSGDAVTLTWLGVDNVTWYEIWIGTNQNDVYEPIHHQPWTLASEFDCEQPGTCTFTLETELVNNIYEWWIRAWGPGGFNSGGTSGWLRLGRFEVP